MHEIVKQNQLVKQNQDSNLINQFRDSREKLIRDTLCRGASDNEIDLFLAICSRLGLDPLARQIFAVKRWDSDLKRQTMAVHVSIDGFRLIAERSGQYQGQTATEWCGDDGVWRHVWLERGPPRAARVGVRRTDFVEPLYAVAKWESYCQLKKDGTPVSMWRKMPDLMLAKCAEALALRKAFPNDLSGVYTTDEMGQSRNRIGPDKQLREPINASELDSECDDDDLPDFSLPSLKSEQQEEAQLQQEKSSSNEIDTTPTNSQIRQLIALSNDKRLNETQRAWIEKTLANLPSRDRCEEILMKAEQAIVGA